MIPFQQTPSGCRAERCGRREIRLDGDRIGVQWHTPRALPWLRIARVPRFGRSLAADPARVVDRLVSWARQESMLRLDLQVWNEDPDARSRLARILEGAGFRESRPYLSYRRTIWMDLAPREEELLAGFHATGRRHIRAPEKRGLGAGTLADPRYADRLSVLIGESFRRSDGRPPDVEWAALLREAARPESAVRMEGLFEGNPGDPGALVSFAVAYLHGDVAEYAHAGATRLEDSTPLLYAPTWRLMKWAKARGARWWDFGGVAEAEAEPSLDGIRTFKEYFCRNTVRVGEEWSLNLRPFWSGALSALGDLKARLSPSGPASS